MRADPYILWTEQGVTCRVLRAGDGFEVCVQTGDAAPFLRRVAHSDGDAHNQGEFLRLLLGRSRKEARRPSLRVPLVFIVEDDPESLFAYEGILHAEGFRTASAASLADAARLLREVRPSAVLLGHRSTDAGRARVRVDLRDAAEGLPIVVMTDIDPSVLALSSPEAALSPPDAADALDEADALDAAGAADAPDAILTKPCRPETLIAVLKLLHDRRKPGAAKRRRTPERRPLESIPCPRCGTSGALRTEQDGTDRFVCQGCGAEAAIAASHRLELPGF